MSQQGKMNYKKLGTIIGIPLWYVMWLLLITYVPGFHEDLDNFNGGVHASAWVHALMMSVLGFFAVIIGALIVLGCAIGLKKAFKAFWRWLHK